MIARNIQEDANGSHGGDQRGTAKADEGQRHAGERNQRHHRADIEEGLHRNPTRKSDSQQRAVGIGRASPGAKGAVGDKADQEQHRDAADKAKLFANDGENGVGPGIGQKACFLAAGSQSQARQAAGTERDKTLADLIGGIGGAVQRMQEGFQPRRPERRAEGDVGSCCNARYPHRHQMQQIRARGGKHRHGKKGDDDGRAQVVLQDDQRDYHAGQDGERDRPVSKAADLLAALAREPIGNIEREGEFSKFARLKGEGPNRQPALAAVELSADDQYQDKQEQRAQQRWHGDASPVFIRNSGGDEHGDDAQSHPQQFAPEPVRRVVIVRRRAGAVDHHQAKAEQRSHGDEELIIASSRGRGQRLDTHCFLRLFILLSLFADLAQRAASAPLHKRARVASLGAWVLFNHGGCHAAFALWRRGDVPQAIERWRANNRWLVILLFIAHRIAIAAIPGTSLCGS